MNNGNANNKITHSLRITKRCPLLVIRIPECHISAGDCDRNTDTKHHFGGREKT